MDYSMDGNAGMESFDMTALRGDCGKCAGLCCVALYFARSDGFPADKAAGTPCGHLLTDFRCDIHAELAEKGLRGCTAYDCFGAGQLVTGLYAGRDWRSAPERAGKLFAAFKAAFDLNQMELYLREAYNYTEDGETRAALAALLNEKQRLCEALDRADVEGFRDRVNAALKRVIAALTTGGRQLSGHDLIGRDLTRARLDRADMSMALLIAAKLRGCRLRGVCLLGADLRDADIRDADLRDCLFLTQMQLNGARGNAGTRLPEGFDRPAAWA